MAAQLPPAAQITNNDNNWPADGAGLSGPKSFSNLGNAYNSISQMLWPERVLVYSSVFGLRPKRCLEIGTFQGGSTLLIVAALDDIGDGKLICVDPYPKVTPENWAKVSHRATMIQAMSPEALAMAEIAAGGKFDWALIDGEHDYNSLVRDLEGTLTVLDDRAYILFHDANYVGVDTGLRDMFAEHPELTDLGMMSTPRVPDQQTPGIFWGGIRMARFDRRK